MTNTSNKLVERNNQVRKKFLQVRKTEGDVFAEYLSYNLSAKSSFTAFSNNPLPGEINFKSVYVIENKINQRL